MVFQIDTPGALNVSDAEIHDMLTKVYVDSGFTAPESARLIFSPPAVRSRGHLLCARPEGGAALAGMVIVVPPDSQARRLAHSDETEMQLLAVNVAYRRAGLDRALQRPLKRAYERDPKAVAQWLEQDNPAIVERAKAEDAEIHWGEETAVSSVELHPRGYAPKERTPVRFMVYRHTFTAAMLIRFLKRLIRDSDKKIFLVLDNLRVHHSRTVRDWLEAQHEHLELFLLPSYSPDLNPNEYLNRDLKARINAGHPVRDGAQLKKNTLSQRRSLQRQPPRIRSYFHNDNIRYAA